MAYLPFVSSPVAKKRYTSPTMPMVRPCGGVLIVGLLLMLCSFSMSSFTPRQRPHKLRRSLDSSVQLVVVHDALRLDRHPIYHRLAGDVEHPDMRLPQRCLGLVGTDAGDESVLPDADKHVAVNKDAPSLISS